MKILILKISFYMKKRFKVTLEVIGTNDFSKWLLIFIRGWLKSKYDYGPRFRCPANIYFVPLILVKTLTKTGEECYELSYMAITKCISPHFFIKNCIKYYEEKV